MQLLAHYLWGHSQMTSAERGREGGTQILTQYGRLRDFRIIDWPKMLTRGEGVNNPKYLADIICERPLSRVLQHTCRNKENKEIFNKLVLTFTWSVLSFLILKNGIKKIFTK